MRILIVDDHAVVRAGTRLLLQETGTGYICEEASGCSDALRKVQTGDYDVVLLGLTSPDLGGFDTLAQIKRKKPSLPLVVFNMHRDEQHAINAYALGADGYVDEENAPVDLVLAIEQVIQGKKFISEHQIEELLASLRKRTLAEQVASKAKPLSRRETQVAELLVSGATNKEIAWRLSLSIKTVSTYKMRILDKLSLNNLTELIKYQMSQGHSDIPAGSRAAPIRHLSG